jgi:hypothetical protein
MKITCPPGVLVPDVSRWNDHLNISELAGHVKAIILGFYKKWVPFKYVLNDNCRRIADQVAASGIPLMAYKYYYCAEDPIKDADWFMEAMQPYPVKFAWADCEDVRTGYSAAFRSEQARRFMLALHSGFPKSGIYTARWYVDGWAPDMNTWIAHYQTWIAQWKYQPSLKTMMSWEELKKNWLPNYDVLATSGMLPEKFMGHQFTGDRCILPGVYDFYNRRQPLDVSVFNADFINNLGNSAPPPPPPPPPDPGFTLYFVLSWQLNVRTGPGAGYGIAYTVKQNTVLKVTSAPIVNGYTRLVDGNWVYAAYLSAVQP